MIKMQCDVQPIPWAYIMNKITKGELHERVANKMANMSASILRNIVASTFDVKPNRVKLSGVIPDDWIGEYCTGQSYVEVSNDEEILFSWDSINGFKQVENCYSGIHYWNGNHDSERTTGLPLYECVTSNEVFFTLLHKQDNKITSCTVFKAPNFAQKWAEIEKEDIARWEQWVTSK